MILPLSNGYQQLMFLRPSLAWMFFLSSTSSPKEPFKYKMRTTVVVQYKSRKANTDLS